MTQRHPMKSNGVHLKNEMDAVFYNFRRAAEDVNAPLAIEMWPPYAERLLHGRSLSK